jgi:hypothetical protein
MGTKRTLGMLAALALATAAYGQTQPTPQQTPPDSQVNPSTNPGQSSNPSAQPGEQRPSGASSPHQREVTSEPATESPPQMSSGPSAAASPHQKSVTRLATANGVASGMAVQTESGQPLGFVVDVLPGSTGTQESGYVVIAGSGGAATPVPYAAASSMLKDGKIVIDHARFQSAPKVQQNQIEDSSGWKKQADKYWGQSGSHSMEGSEESDQKGETPK